MQEYLDYIKQFLGAVGLVAIIAAIKSLLGKRNVPPASPVDTSAQQQQAAGHENQGAALAQQGQAHEMAGDTHAAQAQQAAAKAEKLQAEITATKQNIANTQPDSGAVPEGGQALTDALNAHLQQSEKKQ